jgi:hypothetical protein
VRLSGVNSLNAGIRLALKPFSIPEHILLLLLAPTSPIPRCPRRRNQPSSFQA